MGKADPDTTLKKLAVARGGWRVAPRRSTGR